MCSLITRRISAMSAPEHALKCCSLHTHSLQPSPVFPDGHTNRRSPSFHPLSPASNENPYCPEAKSMHNGNQKYTDREA